MIRFRLKELIADLEFREERRVKLEDIAEATGIHRTTLSKIKNQRNYNTTTEVLDKLCVYFNVGVGDVAEHVKAEHPKKEE